MSVGPHCRREGDPVVYPMDVTRNDSNSATDNPFGTILDLPEKERTLTPFLIEEIKGYKWFDFPWIASPDVVTQDFVIALTRL